MPSLLARIKKGFKERRETLKKEKHERQAIEREAKEQARKEYLQTLRQEKIATYKAQAKAKAKRDASPKTFGFGGAGKSAAKSVWKGLSGAGQNILKESADFELPNMDFTIGVPTKKRKRKKQKVFNPLEDF